MLLYQTPSSQVNFELFMDFQSQSLQKTRASFPFEIRDFD